MNGQLPPRPSELLDILAAFDLPPDAPQLGAYFLGEVLGEDRFTRVHLAVDPTLPRAVAIKRLRPEATQDPAARERLQHEVTVLGAVESHEVVRLYRAELDAPQPYFVMELILGHTLQEFARMFGPLSPHPVMIMTCELARALIPVHAAGFVHCRLHPARVIIHSASEGRLVLLAFGQAAILDDPDGETPLEPQGHLVVAPGELAYIPPELMLGTAIGVKADQFALAVMAYELLTGRPPFEGRTVEAQLDLIRRGQYVRPQEADPRAPDALAEVIERGLAFDPAERWPNMRALAGVLEQGLRQEGFEDPSVELCSLLARPGEFLSQVAKRVGVALGLKTLALAGEGHTTAAAAACRRVLAWFPEHAIYKELLAKLEPGGNGHGVGHQQQKMRAALEADPMLQARTLMEEADIKSAVVPEVILTPEPRPQAVEPEGPAPETEEAEAKPTPVPKSRVSWAVGGLAAGTLLVIALLVGARILSGGNGMASSSLKEVLPQPLTARPFSARLVEPALSSYLPVRREESEGKPQVKIDPEALGQLEKKGELHAAAIGSLLKGSPGSEGQALAYFDRLDPPPEEEAAGTMLKLSLQPSRNPGIDSERAAIFLQLKQPAETLRLTSSALLAQPEHPAARWNQALALQDLGSKWSAIETFGRIKASGEPGWSEEAGMRMAALQADVEKERRAFEEVKTKGRAMVAGGPVMAESLVEIVPGHVQLYFYDGVRTATSAARVLEFLPLAKALDRRNGGEVLERYVRRIAGRFSARRAQLAGVYAQLAANYDALKGGALKDYFAQLRAASEGDMLLGAMVLTQRVSDHLVEFKQLARATGDPWFDLLAENEAANVEMARGEYPQAEDRLLAASRTCGEQGLEFRCIRLEASLTPLYIRLHALPEAEMHAKAGLELARKTGDWTAETRLIQYLGEIAFGQNDPILGRVYLDETMLREPERCERQRYVHEWRALAHVRELQFEEARREILAEPLCDQPRTLWSCQILAVLDRVGLAVEPTARLREELAVLRRQGGLSPGELAIADYIEGFLVIEHDRQEGRDLLQTAIAKAERLPLWDADARNVISHSYEELSVDAAKAGDSEEAQAMLAKQQGVPLPPRCMFGIVIADERAVVTMRDAHGMTRLRYQARRAGPDIDLARLVPDDFKAALRGCPHVDVFAPPLFYRSPNLLPSDITWSFRGGSRMPASGSIPYHQLVVHSAEPPAGLGVRARAPWNRDIVTTDTRTVLEGARATPANVLKEMQNASEILIDAPCLSADGIEYLALSVGSDRQYALTGSMVLRQPLRQGPLVFLDNACKGGTVSEHHEPSSLPMSLRQAGARAVFAAVGSIPDIEGRRFRDMVLERIHAGQTPAAALQDERMIWLKKNQAWVRNIILFE
jgi:tetratricopeptide (TPR) repeat protein